MRKKNGTGWKMVWVKVRDDFLICYKRWKSFEEIFVIELTITSLKVNENLVFKLISPKVEAEFKSTNEVELQSWKLVIENAIKKGLKTADSYNPNLATPVMNNNLLYHNLNSVNSSNSNIGSTYSNNNLSLNNSNSSNSSYSSLNFTPFKGKYRLARIESQYWKGNLFNDEKNAKCADCDAEDPEWASMNLGIVLCHSCSGIHRSMGVHVSKVKSLFLDRWSEPQLKILDLIGNDRSNAFWENQLKDFPNELKPNRYSNQDKRQKYIHSKYIQKLFIRPAPISPALFDEVCLLFIIIIILL